MLGSRLHPNLPSLVWQIAMIPRSLIQVLLILFHLVNGAHVAVQQTQNISVPVTSSQLIYSPFVCNALITSADSKLCSGAWYAFA